MIHTHMMLSSMEQNVHIQHWMKALDMLNLETEEMLKPVTIILMLLPSQCVGFYQDLVSISESGITMKDASNIFHSIKTLNQNDGTW